MAVAPTPGLSIADQLAGSRIAVTGGTGFLGTALIERLLRSAPGCDLVLLIRPGQRRTVAQRAKREIFKNDAFDRLRAELADAGGETFDEMIERRVTPIPGDVGTDGLDQESLDRLELRAAHVWRDLTHTAAAFEPRPWIGAIRVTEKDAFEAVGAERIRRLVTSRTLDAACVVVLDRPALAVRSPNPVTSIESFAAALTGRCLVLAAGDAATAR